MQKIKDRKTPEKVRTTKKHFSISKEMANRKVNIQNIHSEDGKNRMYGSRHSVSSI